MTHELDLTEPSYHHGNKVAALAANPYHKDRPR